MPPAELSGPDLDGVVADANAVGLPYVVIGGFSVIAHGYLRAAKDSATRLHDDGKRLEPADIDGAEHLRARSTRGIVDILRGALAPLDYETVAADAIELDRAGESAPFASLRSLVGFKRLAGRGQDRLDLENLERVNGELPVDPIPGLDS